MVHYYLVATSTENGLQRSSSFLCGPERELHQSIIASSYVFLPPLATEIMLSLSELYF
jgi:hypothetical protein